MRVGNHANPIARSLRQTGARETGDIVLLDGNPLESIANPLTGPESFHVVFLGEVHYAHCFWL
jgi:hypothetical protein